MDFEDFVDPIPERLTLRGGHFVDIRRRLNHGETEDMFALIAPHGLMDRKVVRTAKIEAYLLSWSLTNKGVPVPMSPELPPKVRLDTIRSLSHDRAIEIFEAIEAHEARMDAAREAQKKTSAGVPPAGATSPLLSAPDGGSISDASVN